VIGALVMAYGSPSSPEQIEGYYTHIRHGRPPSAEQLADLVRRYDAIGGVSPLAARSAAQRSALASALGDGWVVEAGDKHAPPFVEDGVGALAAAGVEAIVGVVLAPHYSAASVGEYHARALAASEAAEIPYRGVDAWWDLDEHVEVLARSLRSRLDAAGPNTKVLFTAHSLPERVLVDDPYPDQLHAGAAAIAERAGLLPWGDWGLAWQSAGRTPEPWRGPDILAVLDDLADTGRAAGVVVVPHGFTTEHLEVLYDLDIAAAARAEARGLAFARTDVVDDDAAVMGALARRVAATVP
jgi:ferrochelatase